MHLVIEFPDNEAYRTCLGRLRKALKPYIRDLHVRRRSKGVLVSGSPDKIAAALLILPSGYSPRELSR
jgi:hypothetical protein